MGSLMQELIGSGRIVDIILVVMLAEMGVLLAMRRMGLVDLVVMMLPGACLLLALRAALVGAPWSYIAASLAASFVAHMIDVVRRSAPP
jgi:hypothetical protein